MSELEGQLDVQQPSATETEVQATAPPATEPTPVVEPVVSDAQAQGEPHPLEPEGDRFKQVWARAKKAEERAASIEAELQREREERIRYEERLKAKEEAKVEAQPQYTWEQLQAAVDQGTITFAKALEIRDQQLYTAWEKKQQAREEQITKLSSVSTEINEYKKLVPNALVPGTDERQKVEREYGFLVQRLGRPTTKDQEISYELAAARAAFGDLDTLRTKQQLSTKPLPKETYMETSGGTKKPTESKKDFRSTLTQREVSHYERLMKSGRYPGGWADVEQEHKDYDAYKAGRA